MKKNIVETFHTAYDEEVEKHLKQEELEKMKVKAKELKEQAKLRASMVDSFDSKEGLAVKRAGKGKKKEVDENSE